jgi:hypothetical protein
MPDTPHRDPMQEFADRIIGELEKGVKPCGSGRRHGDFLVCLLNPA